jgi:endonuclease YncB( thermonuclease family)
MSNAITQLQISGQINITQFWPDGESDADTTKLIVQVSDKGFRVKLPGAADYVATNAYKQAYLRGVKLKDGSFKHNNLINSKGEITVRLQRVDAPELHISPGPIKGKTLSGTGEFKRYRQRQAETATVALRKLLLSHADASKRIACTFETNLDSRKGPAEALDKYGRFVGDIFMGAGSKRINLNLWLLQQGWVVIALYDSMLLHEIEESLAAAKQASKSGIRPMYRSKFEPFEPLEFRGVGASIEDEGKSKYIHPKYYRRYVTWLAHLNAGNIKGSFADFLVQRAEEVFKLDEFVAALRAGKDKPAQTYPLYDKRADGDGVSWPPEWYIFMEAPSTVYTSIKGVETKLSAW